MIWAGFRNIDVVIYMIFYWVVGSDAPMLHVGGGGKPRDKRLKNLMDKF